MIQLKSKQMVNIRNSSKGNQMKWFDEDKWYKTDYLGYESLAEYVVSKLLKKTNITEYVDYEISAISYNGNAYMGCISTSFLSEGEEIITLEKLFRQCCEVDITRALVGMELEVKLKYVVEKVEALTGLREFGKYLTKLLELDAVMLNEDRHMNNIAVIRSDITGKYAYCPVFDNGAALFSDTSVDFGLQLSVEACFDKIEAKPFSKSFDEQMDVAEALYGQQLILDFTIKDVEEILAQAQGYSEDIKNRVRNVLELQLRKYKFLMK